MKRVTLWTIAAICATTFETRERAGAAWSARGRFSWNSAGFSPTSAGKTAGSGGTTGGNGEKDGREAGRFASRRTKAL